MDIEEVEYRLKLEDEVADLREKLRLANRDCDQLLTIVERVAPAEGWPDSDGPMVCMFCTKTEDRYSKDWELVHTADCPVTKARAFIAERPNLRNYLRAVLSASGSRASEQEEAQ